MSVREQYSRAWHRKLCLSWHLFPSHFTASVNLIESDQPDKKKKLWCFLMSAPGLAPAFSKPSWHDLNTLRRMKCWLRLFLPKFLSHPFAVLTAWRLRWSVSRHLQSWCFSNICTHFHQLLLCDLRWMFLRTAKEHLQNKANCVRSCLCSAQVVEDSGFLSLTFRWCSSGSSSVTVKSPVSKQLPAFSLFRKKMVICFNLDQFQVHNIWAYLMQVKAVWGPCPHVAPIPLRFMFSSALQLPPSHPPVIHLRASNWVKEGGVQRAWLAPENTALVDAQPAGSSGHQ